MTFKDEISWKIFKVRCAILDKRSQISFKIVKTLNRLAKKHLCPRALVNTALEHFARLVVRKGDMAKWSQDFVLKIGV